MTRPLAAFLLALVAVAGAAGRPVDSVALKVGDLKRTAAVHAPANGKKAAPVVFVFHGHGGTSADAAREFALHDHWPAAVVVYPQGVRTAAPSDPEGKEFGWQREPGEHGDRDLKFFDALLAKVRAEHPTDPKRVYAAGFSNGAAFTVLLWGQRGDELAAVAAVSGLGKERKALPPRPFLHISGAKEGNGGGGTEKALASLRTLNGCSPDGRLWAKAGDVTSTIYESKTGTPQVSGTHPGGHLVPAGAGELVARFFKDHPGK